MKKISNKTLIICFLSLLFICITAAFVVGRLSAGSVAVVRVDGKEYAVINLLNVTEPYLLELPTGNVLLIERGAVSMHEATCKDKLCVKHGKIGDGGGALPIVCLPNRVIVELRAADENAGSIDAVSGR